MTFLMVGIFVAIPVVFLTKDIVGAYAPRWYKALLLCLLTATSFTMGISLHDCAAAERSIPPAPSTECRPATAVAGGDGGMDRLVSAIEHVESRGDPRAHNTQEDAVGVLQIRPIMVRDCNRILGRPKFTLLDRWSPERSREMFFIYTDHYSENASRETIARRWNGGPKGDTRRATDSYWHNVKDRLNALSTGSTPQQGDGA